jgi:NDP-sugar pyrophosphorylase family protein
LEPEVLKLIPKEKNSSFEYDVFPAIIEKKMSFAAFDLGNSYWRDIGTCKSYLEAHHDYLMGKIPGVGVAESDRDGAATTATIDKESVIGPACVIKPGAHITNSVLGAGVTVEEKAVIKDSVIWPHTRVSTAAEIKGAIVGRGSHIGRNTTVSEGSVLGDKTSLPDYSQV